MSTTPEQSQAAAICQTCRRPIANEARNATDFVAPGPSPADFCFARLNGRECGRQSHAAVVAEREKPRSIVDQTVAACAAIADDLGRLADAEQKHGWIAREASLRIRTTDMGALHAQEAALRAQLAHAEAAALSGPAQLAAMLSASEANAARLRAALEKALPFVEALQKMTHGLKEEFAIELARVVLASAPPPADETASLRAQVDRLKNRLQIDPGGSDKIDELEQSIQFREHSHETALKSLRAELDKAKADLRDALQKAEDAGDDWVDQDLKILTLQADLARVTAERDEFDNALHEIGGALGAAGFAATNGPEDQVHAVLERLRELDIKRDAIAEKVRVIADVLRRETAETCRPGETANEMLARVTTANRIAAMAEIDLTAEVKS